MKKKFLFLSIILIGLASLAFGQRTTDISPYQMIWYDADVEIDHGSVANFDSSSIVFYTSTNEWIMKVFDDDGQETFDFNSGTEIFELIGASSTKPIFILQNTNADAQATIFKFYKNSASPADGDDLGAIDAYGETSTGSQERYAYILLSSSDVTNGDTGGEIEFVVVMDAVEKSLLNITGYNGVVNQGTVTINKDGQDVDFIVEASGVSDAWIVEGSSGNVSTSQDLTVEGGDITGANGNAIDIGEAVDGTITFSRDDAGTVILTTADSDANADLTIVPGGTGNLLLGDAGGTTQIVSSDWTISTTGVVTNIDEFDGTDIDYNGYYALDLQNIPDLAAGAGKTAYWFDGIDDRIVVSDDANIDFGTTDFSIVLDAKIRDQSATEWLVAKGGAGAVGWSIYSPASTGELKVQIYDDSQQTLSSSFMPTANDWFNFAITADRDGNGITYGNGKETSSVSITAYEKTISNAIDLYIGSYSTPSDYIAYDISRLLLFNLNLTAAEVKALSSGAPIPYKYLGASQTLIVPSDDCADDDVVNWTDANGALTDNGTEYTYTVTTGANVASFTDEAALTVGKKYRATVLAKDGTGAGSTVRINALTNADAVIENGTGITVAAGFAKASVEWVATETNNKVQIEIVAGTVSDGQTVLFDEIETNSIGCLAQYEPNGIASGFWYDKSGNNLTGTVSGALDINREIPLYNEHHGADDNVDTDDVYVLVLDPVPSAYVTGMMVTLTVTTANTGACTLNVNGLGAKNIKVVDGGDPQNGDISVTGVFILVYNGTSFILTNPETTTTS